MKATLKRAIALGTAAALLVSCLACGPSALEEYRRKVAERGTGRSVTTQSKNGLALSIFPRQGKHTFRAKSPILIDVRLTNVTDGTTKPTPINVYTEISRPGLLLFFDLFKVKENGEPVQIEQTVRQDITLEERMGKYPNHVKLQPGFFIGRPIYFPSRRLGPGIYEVAVTYDNRYDTCPLSPDLTFSQIKMLETDSGNPGFVTLWKGILRSNTVVFEVLEDDEPAPSQ